MRVATQADDELAPAKTHDHVGMAKLNQTSTPGSTLILDFQVRINCRRWVNPWKAPELLFQSNNM